MDSDSIQEILHEVESQPNLTRTERTLISCIRLLETRLEESRQQARLELWTDFRDEICMMIREEMWQDFRTELIRDIQSQTSRFIMLI
jgi:hypothetical protein